MSLHRKLTLVLLAGVLLTLLIAQSIQQFHSSTTLNAIAVQNQAIMEEMAIRNVENVEKATSGFI